MTEIKSLKAEDILWVIEHGVKEAGLKAVPNKDMEKIAKEREESGMCVTGWVDGVIAGCGGIDLLREGVGEAWLLLSYETVQKPIETYEVIREGFEKLIKDHKLRRIQGYGRIDFHKAHNLFKHLGFEVEGKMRKYTPDGVDCIMYALIRE